MPATTGICRQPKVWLGGSYPAGLEADDLVKAPGAFVRWLDSCVFMGTESRKVVRDRNTLVLLSTSASS